MEEKCFDGKEHDIIEVPGNESIQLIAGEIIDRSTPSFLVCRRCGRLIAETAPWPLNAEVEEEVIPI